MNSMSRRTFSALAASAVISSALVPAAFAADKKAEGADPTAADEKLKELEEEAVPQSALAGQDTPETRGEVDATRTYVMQNATDDVVTELYIYETPAEGEEVADKGKNLAGDGLKRGEQVSVTVTGGFIGTDAETLFTCEYVCGDTTYTHDTMHVEDLLFDKVIYLVAADGVSSATPLSFGSSNL